MHQRWISILAENESSIPGCLHMKGTIIWYALFPPPSLIFSSSAPVFESTSYCVPEPFGLSSLALTKLDIFQMKKGALTRGNPSKHGAVFLSFYVCLWVECYCAASAGSQDKFKGQWVLALFSAWCSLSQPSLSTYDLYFHPYLQLHIQWPPSD